MFEGFDHAYDESARLCILRCLSEQNDYRLTDSMIEDIMTTRYAINKGRGYIRNQVAWLHDTAGAVVAKAAGQVIIVELTEAGLEHVERRRVLPGIKRPGAARIG